MKYLQFHLATALLAIAPYMLVAQQAKPAKPKLAVITLTNPSFEDTPRSGALGGAPPAGWFDCGGIKETSPDIQPGSFGVVKTASNGSTYLGLVVRDNETYESVAQRLSQPLEAGKCYEWNMDLCRSEEYTSQTSTSNSKLLSFSSAVQLRVWGGNGFCDRAELLYTTPYVVNTRWLGYIMTLKPKKNYSFIVIEAFFKTPMLFPYNGNVLIDNASAIKQIDCSEKKEEPIAKVTPPTPKPKPKDTTKQKTAVTTAKAVPPTPKIEPQTPAKNLAEADPSKLRKGDVLQVQNLYFDANKFDIKADCENTLNELYRFLSRNGKVVVEVGGHTNNRPSDTYANDLSANRAKAVADWLIRKGIPASRVQHKGYGKTMPIAPNTTAEGQKKNQRVEIKVLSING